MIARFISFLIGIWLMVAPALLGYGGSAVVNDRICGPLIISISIIAMWEVTRALRWVNAIIGFWLMLAPLVLHYVTWRSAFNNLLCAFILLVCAVVPGKRTHNFGGGWTGLFNQ